jgi:hypothetical protein
MNSTLAPFLRKSVLVFFDDILVYSHTYEHLEQVFEILQKEKWTVKLSKCSFAKREIAYLGYVISEQGVSICPSKIKFVAEWPVPQNVRELWTFLGLVGYYRKFEKKFGIISGPLTDLLKKDRVFQWNLEQTESFEALKYALVHAPVLAIPNFAMPFIIETDSSEIDVGGVLM